MKFKPIITISAFFLCSCATVRPVPHDPHEGYSLSASERAAIDKAVTQDLFDPYSAHIEDVSAGRDLAKPGLITFCGQLNAKNRMGAYTGKSPFYGNLRDGKVIFTLIDSYDTKDAALNCLGFYDSLLAVQRTKTK